MNRHHKKEIAVSADSKQFMTLQQLRYVIDVAETGSLSAAAKRLFISQPSLSAAIKGIEDRIGITIFLRNNRGVSLTKEGQEFVRYAKQVALQADVLETKYAEDRTPRQRFSISSQHYTFASIAFSQLINRYSASDYELKLRETTTQEVIDDVKNLDSEVGIIFLSRDNEQVIGRILKESDIVFSVLFTVYPHVLIGKRHPLFTAKKLSLTDIEDYPCISFSQGEHNPVYFSEEVMSALRQRRSIVISDRGALADILIHTDAYIFSTGVYLSGYVNDIASIPLDVKEKIRICLIRHKDMTISPICKAYQDILTEIINQHFHH